MYTINNNVSLTYLQLCTELRRCRLLCCKWKSKSR